MMSVLGGMVGASIVLAVQWAWRRAHAKTYVIDWNKPEIRDRILGRVRGE